MMSDMQTARPRRRAATPEFVELCKTLYGDVVDPQVIWDDVFKAGPDSADVHVKRSSLRTNIERGSNALGLTAAGMATGAALRDDRFAEGGKVAQKLNKWGHAIPKVISGRKGRVGAYLAGGALLTQGANMSGDALIANTYANKQKKAKKGTLQPVGKSVASEVMGAAHKVKSGYLKLWKPTTKVVSSTTPKAGTAAATAEGAARVKNDTVHAGRVARSTDVGRMLGTQSGKILTGGVAGVGALKANKTVQNSKNAGLTYVPDDVAYGKSADGILWAGEFSKFDDDKHLAFGWASVVAENGQPVVDKQGDYISPEDIEDAAYAYVHKSRVGGDNHQRNGEVPHKVSDLVESMVFTDDKVAKMGLPDDFPRGWWVGFKVHDPSVWSEVRKGNRTGFSIHGRGIRTSQSLDSLMGYR